MIKMIFAPIVQHPVYSFPSSPKASLLLSDMCIKILETSGVSKTNQTYPKNYVSREILVVQKRFLMRGEAESYSGMVTDH